MVRHTAAGFVSVVMVLFAITLSSTVETRHLTIRSNSGESRIFGLVGGEGDVEGRLQRTLLQSKVPKAEKTNDGKGGVTRRSTKGERAKGRTSLEAIIEKAEKVAQKKLEAEMKEARAKGGDAGIIVKWNTEAYGKQLPKERMQGKVTSKKERIKPSWEGENEKGASSRLQEEERKEDLGPGEDKPRIEENTDAQIDETRSAQEAAVESTVSKERNGGQQSSSTEDVLTDEQTEKGGESEEKGDISERVKTKKMTNDRSDEDDSKEESSSEVREEAAEEADNETGGVRREDNGLVEQLKEDVQGDESQRKDNVAEKEDSDADTESTEEEKQESDEATGRGVASTERQEKEAEDHNANDEEVKEETGARVDADENAVQENPSGVLDGAQRQRKKRSASTENRKVDGDGEADKVEDEQLGSLLKGTKETNALDESPKEEGPGSKQEDDQRDSLEQQAGDGEGHQSTKTGTDQDEEKQIVEAGNVEEEEGSTKESVSSQNVQGDNEEVETTKTSKEEEDNEQLKVDLTKRKGNRRAKRDQKAEQEESREKIGEEKLQEGGEPQVSAPLPADVDARISAFEKAQEQLAEELNDVDDYDLSTFLSGLTNAGENLGRTLHGVKQKTQQIFVPKAGNALKTTKSIVDKTGKMIHENLEPIIGPNVPPWLSTTTSYILLLLPIAMVALAFERIRASLSLQKVILALNMYLAAYTFVLFVSCFLLGAEPMSLLRSSNYDSYIVLQLVQLGGYLVYLGLQVTSAVLLWRAASSEPLGIVISLTQCIVAAGVGLHYYIIVFQHVMVDKHATVTARLYFTYFLIFGSMCASARLRRTKLEGVGGRGSKAL